MVDEQGNTQRAERIPGRDGCHRALQEQVRLERCWQSWGHQDKELPGYSQAATARAAQQAALKGCTEVNLPSPPPVTAPRHLSEDGAQSEPLSLMLALLLVTSRGSCCYPASASSRSNTGSHAEVFHGSPPRAQGCEWSGCASPTAASVRLSVPTRLGREP